LRWRDLPVLWRDLRETFRPRHQVSWGAVVGFGVFLYAFLAQWILVWKPETGGDALAMHLAIALDFARNHVFTFDFHQYIWALAPMGADFCYAAAAVLGGEYAARLLNLATFGTVVFLIFDAARGYVSLGVAFLLAALFASAPIAQLVTGCMFVENFTAALAVGAVCALWDFHQEKTSGSLFLCAFLLGSSVGWKLGGMVIAAALLPFVAVAARRARWAAIAMAVGIFAVPAAFPYVRAYVLTGNPVFPYGNPFFTSRLVEDYLVDYRFQQPLTWRTLYDVTFHTQLYYEGQPGSFAFHYLLLVPLSLALAWKLPGFRERTAAIAGLLALIGVAASQPNARYMYPALPIVMLGGAAALAVVRTLDHRIFHACVGLLAVTAALNMWFLPTSSWYHRDFYLRPLFAERGRLDYIRQFAPVREAVPYLNQTTGGVLFIQHSDIAGVRKPVFSNHWHNLPFRKLTESARSSRQFYDVVRNAGIEHFVGPKSADRSDKNDSALLEFLDLCGEPEFETPTYVVQRIVTNCQGRLVDAAPKFTTRVFPPGTYDDNDPRLSYIGNWDPFRERFPQAHAQTVSFSHRKDAEVRFEFEGSAFVYGYTKAFNRGRAEVWIDNQRAGVLDQYSPEVKWQSTQRYRMSEPGRHAVAIRVMGEKDAKSEAVFVDFDFFVVEP
ncbi:MAG TPA: hypothetical protein VER03_15985, partial [Bryobacteraceae bacterium]|nr:hypothetical protein [Bryobacteraceae bacterium]